MSETNSLSANQIAKTSFFLKSLKFILISYVVSLCLITILSALIVYTDIPEAISGPAIKVITFFGAFLSAFLTSRSSNSRGWLFGMISGALNIAVLTVIGVAVFGSAIFTLTNLLMVFFGGVAGLAGGVLGINSKKN